MNKYLILLFLSISLVACDQKDTSSTTKHLGPKEQPAREGKSLKLVFPVEPNTSQEIMPLKGEQLDFKTKSAQTQDGMYMSMELSLGKLTQEVNQDPHGFFAGFLTFLMNDLGVNFEFSSDFECGGYTGKSFKIIAPPDAETSYAGGRTLLVDGKAYIWFSISKSAESEGDAKRFIESSTIVEGEKQKEHE